MFYTLCMHFIKGKCCQTDVKRSSYFIKGEHFPAVPGGTSSITSGQFFNKNVTLNYLTAQNVLEKCPIFISLGIKGKNTECWGMLVKKPQISFYSKNDITSKKHQTPRGGTQVY